MLVEISNGELLDKISILELKLLEIEDEEKLVNIHQIRNNVEDNKGVYSVQKERLISAVPVVPAGAFNGRTKVRLADCGRPEHDQG